ncbi:MAG: transketolase family protein [Bacteroidales bacterium]|nr:transketolase family protein [Bacteroidales bacterium]MCF8351177.1 transketolase family protein [Bacteroidales bacterium]MCF8377697.1 transketolase family protein [Bacteroidales bacterium]
MRYKNRGNRASKEGFSEGLNELGKRYGDVVSLGADITSSVGMDAFAKDFPQRFISLGIAEQNCVGAAAGLALSGKVPVFSTYGVFAGIRTTDQVRISLCYNDVHVIIGGAHAGVSVGPDGATHQALEDMAVMRVMPNMTVLSPCDATQAKLATIAAYEQCKGPVYVRFGRAPFPDFSEPEEKFEVGKAQLLREGKDVSIIATGHLVWEALLAADMLQEKNIDARVINMHTIKPIDREAIGKAAKETGAIVTAEEHQVHGGLGSAVAEVVVQNQPVPMAIIGMPDRFGESGQPEELMRRYGLTAEAIVDKAIGLLGG